MAHWIGDKVTLKAGPLTGHDQGGPAVDNNDTEAHSEHHRPEYKESYITEYDDIQVYRQQGCYEHTKQLHAWSFYEYRMCINGECRNIIINDDMKSPPDWAYPGSSSAKLSHDFCHIDTEASDDILHKLLFCGNGRTTDMAISMPRSPSRKIYGSGLAPEDSLVITNHQHNEKLNHFYVDRMHEHNILANRTPCWHFTELTNSSGKVTDRTIALNKESRCSSAAHETFKTGFEHKSAMKPMPRREENLHGKRKYSDPSGQTSTQQFDPSGNYSARDLQKLNATFADQSETKSAATVPTHTTSKVTMWRHGEVPPLGPAAEGRARAAKQLAYARTLLTAVMEAATQMEEVVSNLVQIEQEQATAKEEDLGQAASAAPTESCTEPATEGSQN